MDKTLFWTIFWVLCRCGEIQQKEKTHQDLKINLKKISANFFSGKIEPVSVFRCQTVFKNVPILFRVMSVGPVREGKTNLGPACI